MSTNKKTKKYLYILMVLQLLICIVVSVLVTHLTQDVSSRLQFQLKQEALSSAETKMRERVELMLTYIEHQRENVLASVRIQGEIIMRMISNSTDKTPDQLVTWMQLLATMQSGKALKLMLYDLERQEATEFVREGNQVREKGHPMGMEQWQEQIAELPYHLIIPYGPSHDLCIMATWESINQAVKGSLHSLIHSSIYGNDGYVWVNEVLDYNGGDNYAIRRIHPGLPHTEGEFLSTNTPDIRGNLPYKTELEGIRDNGEIFHTYYFKELSSNLVSEKATYAKLYEPFNWIIATGEPLSKIFSYVDTNAVEFQTYSKSLLQNMTTYIIIILVVVFLIDTILIFLSNMKQAHHINRYVEQETRLDPLTKAFSRKVGEQSLDDAFQRFKGGATSPLIMMLDLDNFKAINDTYGHDKGDEVLKRVAEEINRNIRSSDKLFRWGGEEFVLMFGKPDRGPNHPLGHKILGCVQKLQFQGNGKSFAVSVSIGSSEFHEDDPSWRQSLKRADMALYQSKQLGKNRYTNYDTDMVLDHSEEFAENPRNRAAKK